ncbi:gamma-glutamyltransferase [Nibrella saemangeumensis]|uniref:Glutathione hydrolase proenzyme n=1 Tax=Nibrella saemangeumensis TaxID=1084526 RepID=A0ABP8NSM3_9BACT
MGSPPYFAAFYLLNVLDPVRYLTLVFLLVLSYNSTSPALAQDRLSGKAFATRSVVMAQNGMACTSHPLATQAALAVLRSGGNAIDAAIAANAVQGVVEPHMCGIGGDLFAIVWDAKTKKLYGLNASGRSPYGLTLDEFKKRGLTRVPINGPLSVSVPGCVDGWFELHKKFGKQPMERLLAPAIGYARQGFPLHDEAAEFWPDMLTRFGNLPNIKDTYAPGGLAPKRGDIFRNPALASTLEKIAKGGRDAFYKGDMARSIDQFMQKAGGYLRYRDLAEHTSNWIDPVSTNYRGYDVWELPPNGQGITVLQMLNILEGYDFSKISWGSPEHVHLFTEAKKLAFEDRARYYADPDFAQIPVRQLISKDYAAERRKLINPNLAGSKPEAGHPALKNGDTIYLTVADSEGNMVSLIQSIYLNFGSGMAPDGLGFVFQNRGAMYTLQEGQNNTFAPHKRPFHTIIPAFITKDGQPYMSFGVMGGSFQPLGHVQIIQNLIDFGMNLQESGDAPRIDHQGSSEPMGDRMADSGLITLESGFPYETIRELMKKGHKIGYSFGLYGGYQAILYDAVNKVYQGASDARKDGQAAGY